MNNYFLERYSCNLVLDGFGFEGQKRLKNANALVAGLGGIGSVVATYLVANGIGRLGICDYDYVQPNNLTRQILYDSCSTGKAKIDVAYEKLISLNSEVAIKLHFEKIDNNNAQEIFANYDLIIEASDSQDTKFLVNEVCMKMRKKIIICSAISYEGNIVKILKDDIACWQCIYENKIPEEKLPTCNASGVFPTLPGIIGLIATTEIIKYIIGLNTTEQNFIRVNVKEDSIRYLHINRRPDCSLHQGL